MATKLEALLNCGFNSKVLNHWTAFSPSDKVPLGVQRLTHPSGLALETGVAVLGAYNVRRCIAESAAAGNED